MVDSPRSGSLPLLNESEDVQTMMNPAYSGSVTASARYSSRQEIVEMEIELDKPIETPSMKRIKYAIIVLFLLIGVLIVLNISHLVISISERVSVVEEGDTAVSDLEVIIDFATISAPGNITEDVIPSTTTGTSSSSTTTTSPSESTMSSTTQLPSATAFESSEEENSAYRKFTERFNRTYSTEGRTNYMTNINFFSKGPANFGETQFADLSETQLRKLVNPMRDTKRNDTSKRCDIHTYYNNIRQESKIHGTTLYDSHDKIPSRVDLRRRGIVGSVRNQGTSCNGGYSFAVTNLLESKVDTNGSSLSVQMLLASDFNHHCEGGATFRAMRSAEEEGLVTEEELPFDVTQQWHDVNANATRFRYAQACVLLPSHRDAQKYWDHNVHRTIEESDISASTYIKQFLAKLGTVIVEVPVNRHFFFYNNGTYSPSCDKSTILGYQPVVVVGYGMRNGDDIWILRNSFGTEWGMNGDFEMRFSSPCGTFDYAFSFYKAI